MLWRVRFVEADVVVVPVVVPGVETESVYDPVLVPVGVLPVSEPVDVLLVSEPDAPEFPVHAHATPVPPASDRTEAATAIVLL